MPRTGWRGRYSATAGVEEDIEMMLPCSKEEAAQRLGYNHHQNLYQTLRRWGRLDLWWRLEGTGEPNGGRKPT